MSRPAWEWVSGALVVFGAHFVFSGHVLGIVALGLTRLTASAYALAVVLIIFAAIRPTVRAQAGIAVRRAALASESAAERAAVAAIRDGSMIDVAAVDDHPIVLDGVAAWVMAAESRPPSGRRCAPGRWAMS